MKKLLCFLLVMAMMVSLNACCACLPTDFFGGTQIETPPDSPVTIPCTALRLGTTYHVFTLETERLQLDVQTVPADTTDILTYISSDPSVASVDKNGLVTPFSGPCKICTMRRE